MRRAKKKGQKEEDLKDFPQEESSHDVPEEELIKTFGESNYKSMPDEVYWQLRFEPASWIAEVVKNGCGIFLSLPAHTASG